MSVTLNLNDDTIELPDPLPGHPVGGVKRQTLGRTAGGTVYVYDKGVTTYEMELRFASLCAAEKTALTNFFESVAQGAQNTFLYTDPNGTEKTARFLDSRITFAKIAENVWNVRFRLELSSMGT